MHYRSSPQAQPQKRTRTRDLPIPHQCPDTACVLWEQTPAGSLFHGIFADFDAARRWVIRTVSPEALGWASGQIEIALPVQGTAAPRRFRVTEHPIQG